MPHLTASARSRSAWQTPRMSDITTADVRAELEAWLEENWDPDLTVLQWWQRLYEDRWSSLCRPLGNPLGLLRGSVDTIQTISS